MSQSLTPLYSLLVFPLFFLALLSFNPRWLIRRFSKPMRRFRPSTLQAVIPECRFGRNRDRSEPLFTMAGGKGA